MVRVRSHFSFTYSFSLYLFFRLVEPSLLILKPFVGLPHAICLFLYWIRRICWFQKGKKVISVTVNANTEHLNSVLCLMSIWYFSPLKGHYGASLWDCCNAAAAQSAGAGHCLGGISPHPSQHSPWESLWWGCEALEWHLFSFFDCFQLNRGQFYNASSTPKFPLNWISAR